MQALQELHMANQHGQILTGLFHLQQEQEHLFDDLNTHEQNLAKLTEDQTRLNKNDFANFIAEFK